MKDSHIEKLALGKIVFLKVIKKFIIYTIFSSETLEKSSTLKDTWYFDFLKRLYKFTK